MDLGITETTKLLEKNIRENHPGLHKKTSDLTSKETMMHRKKLDFTKLKNFLCKRSIK